ncbi:MAG: hypothetical protein K0R26_1908 [Bacteroidota bacterium]|nr:hypothetical protein [Bacteroidota bacterium]
MAAIALVLFLVWKFTSKPASQSTDKTADEFFNIQDAAPVANDTLPLKVGSRGENVKTLQIALNKINEKAGNKILPLVVDNSFGEKTKSMLLALMGTAYYPVTETGFTTIIQNSTFVPVLTSAPTFTTI